MTIAVDPSDAGDPALRPLADDGALMRRLPGIAVAGVASLGAGAVHAAATGIHAEHPQLARVFVVVAVLQLGVGIWCLLRPNRLVAAATVLVNAGAVAGWVATRVSGISWIDGLEVAEAPQFADAACALLGAVAVGAGLGGVLVGWQRARPPRLLVPVLAATALTIPAMVSGGTHVHAHGDAAGHDHTEAAGASTDATGDGAATGTDASHDDASHDHDQGATAGATGIGGDGASAAATDTPVHQHTDTTVAVAVEEGAEPWPRPWDPNEPLDLSGVEGVTPEQEARATALVEGSLVELAKYADVADAEAAGYTSIGDAGTGSEHFIRLDLVQDDDLLDPKAPESLVYTVNGDQRTLAGAMYIASARSLDDPELLDFAGPLLQWHNHGNLCWDRVNGKAQVVGLVDANGTCARGVNSGGANPMVHVWVTPNPCGVFAALEGVGAGQASVPDDQRVDMCQAGHDHGSAAAPTPVPYDPTKPIDLSGTPGVTPEQQAAAENLVAVTLVRLPQWSDYRDAEAAGFHSIGDGATGHEHFINWDWIDDDVILDPDQPESLVYAPQPDGSKKLVSAMYMLPSDVALEDVPDIGGALMQWHIHDNLCFTTGDAPTVAGLVDGQGNCRAGLQKFKPSAMIHVWITPHPCGPFAALEGVGAGQVLEGQEHLCDHQHGSGTGL
ncbi:MAG: hypothetical protein U0Q03_15030 [Acidimicrobiales bacterium]